MLIGVFGTPLCYARGGNACLCGGWACGGCMRGKLPVPRGGRSRLWLELESPAGGHPWPWAGLGGQQGEQCSPGCCSAQCCAVPVPHAGTALPGAVLCHASLRAGTALCSAMPCQLRTPGIAVPCRANSSHPVPAVPCQPRTPGAAMPGAVPAPRAGYRTVPPAGRLRRAGAGCRGSSPLSCARRGACLPSRTNGTSAAGGFRCLGFVPLRSAPRARKMSLVGKSVH